jgi:hypothetical protein
MEQENGSRFKLVYSRWHRVHEFNKPFANGLPIEYIEELKKYNSTNINEFFGKNLRNSEIDDTFQKENSGNLFRNTIFYMHSREKFSDDVFVNEDHITNDGTGYIYPLEIELFGLTILAEGRKFIAEGKEYNYSFVDTLTPKVLDLLINGNLKLLITNIIDPIASDPNLIKFLHNLRTLGIPKKNIVVMYGNIPRYLVPYEDLCIFAEGNLSLRQAPGVKNTLPCINDLGFESDFVREMDLHYSKKRPKKFISFNRSMNRKHRISLMYLLEKLNIFDQGHFSFLNWFPESDVEDWILLPDRREQKTEIIERMKAKLPYQLDTHDLTDVERTTFATMEVYKKDLYLDSYIHIVTETTFDDNKSIFMSEKTWRPIIMMQPFIYLGEPGSLAKLRSYGFKTFHPFIDESYDDVELPELRFYMIAKEIERLSKMSIQEIHDWYYQIRDILFFNQTHLNEFEYYFPYQALWDSKDIE